MSDAIPIIGQRQPKGTPQLQKNEDAYSTIIHRVNGETNQDSWHIIGAHAEYCVGVTMAGAAVIAELQRLEMPIGKFIDNLSSLMDMLDLKIWEPHE